MTDVNATIRQTCMNALKPEATINKKNHGILKQRSDIHNQTAKVLLMKNQGIVRIIEDEWVFTAPGSTGIDVQNATQKMFGILAFGTSKR